MYLPRPHAIMGTGQSFGRTLRASGTLSFSGLLCRVLLYSHKDTLQNSFLVLDIVARSLQFHIQFLILRFWTSCPKAAIQLYSLQPPRSQRHHLPLYLR